MNADRTLLVLNEIRSILHVHSARFDALDARLNREFSEIHDRLRRLDERIDEFILRVETLESKVE
jgi:division protein CdvB (Snf7/Vps24/ESCRT-III family)